MTRLIAVFLAFLALATTSAGIAYQNLENLVGGNGSIVSALVLVVSTAVFGLAMLVLTRLIRLTTVKEK